MQQRFQSVVILGAEVDMLHAVQLQGNCAIAEENGNYDFVLVQGEGDLVPHVLGLD